MSALNRTIVLDAMATHETLTIDDIGKAENIGMDPNPEQLQFLLKELTESGYLTILPDVVPTTYTINTRGIEERNRLMNDAERKDWV